MQNLNNNTNKNMPIGGYVLVIIGTIFFIGNFIDININWEYIWPLILIGIGVLLILKSTNNN